MSVGQYQAEAYLAGRVARSASSRISAGSGNRPMIWRLDIADFAANCTTSSSAEATDILTRAIYHHAQDLRPQLFD